MSYILDALKRAESERESGAVPGLHSAQASSSIYIAYGSRYRPWWLAMLALLLAVLLGLGWQVWRTPSGDTVPPTTSAVPATPSLATSEATVSAAPVAPVAKAAAAVPAKPLLPAAAAPSAPATASVPVPPKAAVPTPTPALAASGPAPAPTAASGAIPPLGDLPDAVRRQIPALAISGALYSESPPEWTLIINDQVVSKGQQVAPGLLLEDISANSAVFLFKGQRFRVDR
ncbi:hypothetical protein DIC66_14385 [Rhodoferax lacus]|uniref:Type II secretion system protein GspB C-terminal domain-containing protein n=1 Tax=Rhodoferax lacus TaxID=2184758 RepID=A0A3E1R9Z2_9BURK|nr:general secretion pathway protein GspB [Rhodoferax lacus]RFO96188.1 hypothetical protein DIC66_14385 [Rhodoferax lacus]